MVNIFKSLSKTEVDLLNQNPKIMKQLQDFFVQYGFKSFKTSSCINFSDFIEKDLTVYSNAIRFSDLVNFRTNNFSLRSNSRVDGFLINCEQIYNEGENIKISISTQPVGVYFKERNILYINFYILNALHVEYKEEINNTILKEFKI